jgi:hypothetical protein
VTTEGTAPKQGLMGKVDTIIVQIDLMISLAYEIAELQQP